MNQFKSLFIGFILVSKINTKTDGVTKVQVFEERPILYADYTLLNFPAFFAVPILQILAFVMSYRNKVAWFFSWKKSCELLACTRTDPLKKRVGISKLCNLLRELDFLQKPEL